jgi:Flp pilus assembly protein TadD
VEFVRRWRLGRELKKARALEGEGYVPAALAAYETALAGAEGRDRVEALLGVGRTAFRSGGLARARKALAEATALAPDHADAWHLLGVVNFELRDLVGADEAFRAALKHAPDRPDILHSQAESYAAKFPRAGFEAARRVIGILLKDPDAADRCGLPRELPLVFLRNLAAEQRLEEEAAAAFDGLAAPGSPAWIRPLALLQKGILLVNFGRLDEAVAAYLGALSLDPDLDAAHFNLGMAYTRKRDFPAARAAFGVYAKRHPTDATATYGFGFVAETLPDVPELIRLYRRFLDRMATSPPAPRSLGRLDVARGWVDHVRVVLEHAEKHRAEGHETPPADVS